MNDMLKKRLKEICSNNFDQESLTTLTSAELVEIAMLSVRMNADHGTQYSEFDL